MHIISNRYKSTPRWIAFKQTRYKNNTYRPEMYRSEMNPPEMYPRGSLILFKSREEAAIHILSSFTEDPSVYRRTHPYNKFYFLYKILCIEYAAAMESNFFQGSQDIIHHRYLLLPLLCDPDTQLPLSENNHPQLKSLLEDFNPLQPRPINTNLFDPTIISTFNKFI